MTDKLRTAVQAVIKAYDHSLEQDTHSALAPHIKALHEAYSDSSPPFHPSQLFTKGTTGSSTVNDFQLSFKDGELVGVNNLAEPSPIDALIAEIDGLERIDFDEGGCDYPCSDGDNYRFDDVRAVLNKYRGVK